MIVPLENIEANLLYRGGKFETCPRKSQVDILALQ